MCFTVNLEVGMRSNVNNSPAAKRFYNLICGESSIIGGVVIHHEVNHGSLDEVHDYIDKHFNEHPDAKWILIPMQMSM